jgi:chaperonin GroES
MLLPKHKILVKRVEAAKFTPGGLELPEVAQKKENQADVIQVGPGIEDEILIPINTGDQVVFGNYVGTKVVINGVDHMIMSIDEVLVVFPKDEEDK